MATDLKSTSDDEQDVEGLDTASSDGWGDYPLDAVFVRTETRTVGEVIKRINGHRYILDPDFQRDFVWPDKKQSKLIESCVMRIPLPVFYVAEAPDGRIVVVDGLQRLTTFARFITNKLRLTGLANPENPKGSHALEGKFFRELPLNLQERVQDTQLTMYILDAKAPERARLDIFERVNSGEPLTRQQMRNALYNGAATNWLKHAASGSPFKVATEGGLNPKQMRDREAINRFCSFKLIGPQAYSAGDMDAFLAKGLVTLAAISPKAREVLREGFDRSMKLNRKLFGEHAFRKSLIWGKGQRSVINISLFEVCAVTMTDLDIGTKKQEEGLRDAIVELLKDDRFSKSITYSTNSTIAVHTRFREMERVLTKAIGS